MNLEEFKSARAKLKDAKKKSGEEVNVGADDDATIKKEFEKLDFDKSGNINFEKFRSWWPRDDVTVFQFTTDDSSLLMAELTKRHFGQPFLGQSITSEKSDALPKPGTTVCGRDAVQFCIVRVNRSLPENSEPGLFLYAGDFLRHQRLCPRALQQGEGGGG